MTAESRNKTEEDKLRIGRVITYGRVWENKLKELVEVKKLGLRATARELRVDPNTIKRYVALLELTPPWTKNKPKIKSNKVESIYSEDIQQQKRDIWLNLQRKNPELSKTEIRKLAPDVYTWLYRRDRNWLNENSPKLKQPAELCWKRGTALETIEINSQPGNPYNIAGNSHAVLTLGYREQDHPANRVYQRVVEFLITDGFLFCDTNLSYTFWRGSKI